MINIAKLTMRKSTWSPSLKRCQVTWFAHLHCPEIQTWKKSGTRLGSSWISMFNWLVVDLPLWKKYEFVSWDDDIPNIWKNKNHVPNHQPVKKGCSRRSKASTHTQPHLKRDLEAWFHWSHDCPYMWNMLQSCFHTEVMKTCPSEANHQTKSPT